MTGSKKLGAPPPGGNLEKFQRLGLTYEDLFPEPEIDESDPLYQQLLERLEKELPKKFPDWFSDPLLKQAAEASRRHRALFGTEDSATRSREYAWEVISRTLEGYRGTTGTSIVEYVKGLSDVETLNLHRAMAVFVHAGTARQKNRDAAAKRKATRRGAQAAKRARGIIQAGIELAEQIIERSDPLTAESLWDAFTPYTLQEPRKVHVEEQQFEVWREGSRVCEQRRFPPGNLKSISFSVFQKKPYYYRAIRAAFSR